MYSKISPNFSSSVIPGKMPMSGMGVKCSSVGGVTGMCCSSSSSTAEAVAAIAASVVVNFLKVICN